MPLSAGHKGPVSAARETGQVERVALYAFLINLALAGLKVALAFFSGSLAVAASAIDSATDSVASLTVLAGLKLSARKMPTFPYGLYKIENMISVAIALFILFAGFEIVRNIFFAATKTPAITLGLIGWLSGCVVVTFLFGQYAIAVGKRTESPTLIAEGKHRQVDVLSSVVVLLAVVLNYFKVDTAFPGISIDHIAAGLVLVFIGRAAWDLLSDGMRVLLDASLDHATLDHVRSIIEARPMVTEIRYLVGRNAGRYRFVETELIMDTRDLEKAHAITQLIESDIRKKVPHVERVLIHYEPQVREHVRIAVPLSDTAGYVSAHFGEAPHFAMVLFRRSDGEIEKQEIVNNPHTGVVKAKGIRVAEWLVNQKVDIVVVKEDLQGKGPAYVFADAGVELRRSSASELTEVMEFLTGVSCHLLKDATFFP